MEKTRLLSDFLEEEVIKEDSQQVLLKTVLEVNKNEKLSDEDVEKICVQIMEDLIFYVTEEYGRDLVHLIPEQFRALTEEDNLPDILETGVKEAIEILAEQLGCSSYRTQLFEFWFLDIVAEALIQMQAEEMSPTHQKVMVRWFCFFIEKMKNCTDQTVFLEELKKYLLLAGENITSEGNDIPTPDDIDNLKSQEIKRVSNPEMIETGEKEKKKGHKELTLKGMRSFMATITENVAEDSLSVLLKIAKLLKNVFGDEIRFMMLSSFFKKNPLYTDIYSPYTINTPRKILGYEDIFHPAEPVTEKNEKSKKSKSVKGKENEKKPVEQEQEAKTEKLDLDLRDYILPLQMAVDDPGFFDAFWPIEEAKDEKPKKSKPKKK